MTRHPIRLFAIAAPLALLAACASEPTTPEPTQAPVTAPAATAAPEPVTAPAQSREPVRLTVREAQQRLADLGYDPGTIDGIAGPRTANALRQFQRAQGLGATGRLDAETMNALGH